mmetsp:Transcript_35504/g.114130  ORF Transcript_35504/g.114130 Transcript_35504/m.114130 type:complete len:725 (+) Transcript_35504:1802-3976(+)
MREQHLRRLVDEQEVELGGQTLPHLWHLVARAAEQQHPAAQLVLQPLLLLLVRGEEREGAPPPDLARPHHLLAPAANRPDQEAVLADLLDVVAACVRALHLATDSELLRVVPLKLVRHGQLDGRIRSKVEHRPAAQQLGNLVEQVVNRGVRERGDEHALNRPRHEQRADQQPADQGGGEVRLAAPGRAVDALHRVLPREAEELLLAGCEREEAAQLLIERSGRGVGRRGRGDAEGGGVLAHQTDGERPCRRDVFKGRRAGVLLEPVCQRARVGVDEARREHVLLAAPQRERVDLRVEREAKEDAAMLAVHRLHLDHRGKQHRTLRGEAVRPRPVLLVQLRLLALDAAALQVMEAELVVQARGRARRQQPFAPLAQRELLHLRTHHVERLLQRPPRTGRHLLLLAVSEAQQPRAGAPRAEPRRQRRRAHVHRLGERGVSLALHEEAQSGELGAAQAAVCPQRERGRLPGQEGAACGRAPRGEGEVGRFRACRNAAAEGGEQLVDEAQPPLERRVQLVGGDGEAVPPERVEPLCGGKPPLLAELQPLAHVLKERRARDGQRDEPRRLRFEDDAVGGHDVRLALRRASFRRVLAELDQVGRACEHVQALPRARERRRVLLGGGAALAGQDARQEQPHEKGVLCPLGKVDGGVAAAGRFECAVQRRDESLELLEVRRRAGGRVAANGAVVAHVAPRPPLSLALQRPVGAAERARERAHVARRDEARVD